MAYRGKSRNGETNESGSESKTTEMPGGAEAVVQRWSVSRKRDVVLRLLGGASLDAVSREVGVDVGKLEKWKTQGLAGIEAALMARGDAASERELEEALHRVGELSMENELLRRRCGLARPSKFGRSRP